MAKGLLALLNQITKKKKRKKRKGRGKSKGGKFERKICTDLSLWWSKGEHEDLFWRTAGSGARATVRARRGKTTRSHAGDILNTDEIGAPLMKVFCFELKIGYNKITFADLIDKNPRAKIQVYESWISQAKRSQKNAKSKFWCIIHKRDRKETMIILPSSFIHWTNLADSSCHAVVKYQTKKGDIRELAVFNFDNFLDIIHPRTIRGMAKK